jgi:hypothetical protein
MTANVNMSLPITNLTKAIERPKGCAMNHLANRWNQVEKRGPAEGVSTNVNGIRRHVNGYSPPGRLKSYELWNKKEGRAS